MFIHRRVSPKAIESFQEHLILIMETTASGPRTTLIGLFRALTGNTKSFIRDEIQLAKTELSEKLSSMGKNAVSLAVGGLVAYAGVLVLLIGLGWLGGYGLEQAGLSPMLANGLGILGVGLLVAGLGTMLLMKGLKRLKNTSVAPERTMHTLQELKTGPTPMPTEGAEAPKPSSQELQARVEATENRLGQNLDEIGRRLNPSHLNAQMKQKISEQPYRTGMIAMAVGVLSGLILKRKLLSKA